MASAQGARTFANLRDIMFSKGTPPGYFRNPYTGELQAGSLTEQGQPLSGSSSASTAQPTDPNAPFTYLGVTYPSYHAFLQQGPYVGATNALTPHHGTVGAPQLAPHNPQPAGYTVNPFAPAPTTLPTLLQPPGWWPQGGPPVDYPPTGPPTSDMMARVQQLANMSRRRNG